ncbi:hypothetical protein Stube_19460 [Streptomyces tubercidicus]|uniref:Uncharacterized protein n=1 Tax=Streptomyces tubercidicus TaxID=47759 RepID=A0A640UML6_9ACTN|nr:hypothetical protein Stube_19460 [Streptomyces tubercidicus]
MVFGAVWVLGQGTLRTVPLRKGSFQPSAGGRGVTSRASSGTGDARQLSTAALFGHGAIAREQGLTYAPRQHEHLAATV